MRPGEPFGAEDADPAVLAAIEQAPAAARERMTAAQPRMHPLVNGWSMPTSVMGVYGTDYLRRAVIARAGLGANLVEDAVYPLLYFDGSGDTPTGDHDYLLHFDAGALPPADAFWSVTMYDEHGFPVPNATDRYAIGDGTRCATTPMDRSTSTCSTTTRATTSGPTGSPPHGGSSA